MIGMNNKKPAKRPVWRFWVLMGFVCSAVCFGGVPLRQTLGQYTQDSLGWYPETGEIPVVSDRWGNGDAYSFPAVFERGDFADQAYFRLLQPPMDRARRFSVYETEIIPHDGQRVTRLRIEKNQAAGVGFRIEKAVVRRPQKITFTVSNNSPSTLHFEPQYYEIGTTRKWDVSNWRVGPRIAVAPGATQQVEVLFDRFMTLSRKNVEQRGYHEPVFPGVMGFQVLGIEPDILHEFILSDYAVHYGTAPEVELTALELPEKAVCGQPLALSLKTRSAKDDAVLDLEFRQHEYTMWRLRLTPEQRRLLARNGALSLNTDVPDYLASGTYQVGLVSDGYRVVGSEPSVVFENSRQPGLPLAEIGEHKGRQAVFVNGEPVSWVGHASIALAPADTKLFAEAGAQFIVETAAGIGTAFSDDPCWTGDGPPDFSALDERVNMILAEQPDVNLVIRPNFALPALWKQAHSNELAQIEHVDGTRATGESFNIPVGSQASEAWQAQSEELMREMVRHIKAQPWADRVIGFWLCSRVHEWFDTGTYDEMFDYGQRNQERFADWAKTESFLANDPLADEVSGVPAASERTGDGRDFQPESRVGKLTAAVNQYQDQLTRQIIERLAKAIKEESGGRSLAGVHYGYVFVLCDTVRQARSRTMSSFDELIESPYIDFVAGVTVPKNWGLNSHDFYSLPFKALGLRKKHYMLSDDLAFYFTPYKYKPFDSKDPDRGDRFIQQRVFANAVIHGVSPHWFGLRPTWWGNEAAQQTIAEMIRVHKQALSRDVTSLDEVALVIDNDGYAWLQDRARFLRNNSYLLYRVLQRTGAPMGTWMLSDVDRIPDSVKMVVVGFAAAPSPESLEKLRQLIEKGGRTVVVIGRPGLIDTATGAWNRSGPADLLGLPVTLVDDGQKAALIGSSEIQSLVDRNPETVGNRDDQWVGMGLPKPGKLTSKQFTPVPRAVVEGSAPLMYETGEGAFAERSLKNGGKLIWCSMAPLNSGLWRKWVEAANVHCYAPVGCFVHASRELVSVTAPAEGDIEVSFPKPVNVVDLFDPECAEKGKKMDIFFMEGQTRLFDVTIPDMP